MDLHKWRRRAAGALAGLLLLCPAAPARAADSGDVITALAGLLGTAGLYGEYLSAVLDAGNNALYQEQTELVDLQENGVSANDSDQALVNRVMERLVDQGDYRLDIRSLPFRWRVNDNAEFNAACYPTNYVSVNRGLVSGLDRDPDKLAAVLAHEMTHGIRLHAAYNYARAAAQSFGITFLGMATGAVRPDVAMILADYSVAKNVVLPAEYEADEGGFYLAASAGFNPGGGAAAMARMRYLAENPTTFDPGYGEEPYDHPDTDKREAKLSQLMTEYSGGHVEVRDRAEVYIDDSLLLKAGCTSDAYDNTPENAYLIAGGIAKAFHDHDDLAGWNFRPGENGRVACLDDNPAYRPLLAALEIHHADELLRTLVEAAYAQEAANPRPEMSEAEIALQERWQKRQEKNAKASDKLVARVYHNADWYNDVFRPEMALMETDRIYECSNRAAQMAGIYAVRGRAYALLGDFTQAAAECARAVEADAQNAYVYLNRAEVYRAQGLTDKAMADIRHAQELDPKAPAAPKMGGDLSDDLGDTEEAKVFYRAYLNLIPEAEDIPDAYLKELAPKTWKKVLKEREEEIQKAIEAVNEKKGAQKPSSPAADSAKPDDKAPAPVAAPADSGIVPSGQPVSQDASTPSLGK